MWVKAIKDFDCPTHKLAKGKYGDLESRYAEAGIEAGLLEKATTEDYRASLVEKRQTRSPKKTEPKE